MAFKREPIALILKKDSDVPSEMVRLHVQGANHSVSLSVITAPPPFDITDVHSDALVCPSNRFLVFDEYSFIHSRIAAKAGMSLFAQAATKAEKQYGEGYNISIRVPIIELHPESAEHIQGEQTLFGLTFAFAISTTAGRLENQKGVIHLNTDEFVTPMGQRPADYVDNVRSCVLSVLGVADENGFESVNFPDIARHMDYTPGMGWPLSIAVSFKGSVLAIADFLEMRPDTSVKRVGIVKFGDNSWPLVYAAHNIKEQLTDAMRD